ncbi:cysteine methyltransferase [Streptomyces sp. H-KF8]|nr:methylated-DNA--[protein]-cysteine S-methyltransferase [Streptomyces sp. H-KF8]OBQ53952.1 cysteine methyltransferase [Streptomyces sp. H-KF8]
MKRHTVLDSPYGPLTLVADDGGVLCGLYMTDQRHRPPQETFGDRVAPGSADPAARAFTEAGEQLEAYFAGGLKEFTLELRPHGTPFQRRVWDLLTDIPHGETRTYGELAGALGSPKASRAVGLANGRNPIGIVIPCHRVIGASGGLTGYGGGLERKRRLLDFERGRPAALEVQQSPPPGSLRGPRTGTAGAPDTAPERSRPR